MKILMQFLLMGLIVLGVVACSQSTDIKESATINDEAEASDPVQEEEPAIETTEDDSTSDDKNGSENTDEETSIQPEESGEQNSTFQEKYENRQWTAKQEGITYKMTVDFSNEKEGTFDWLVIEVNTENTLEDIKDIPLTVDSVNPDGDVVAYYQYEDERDGALVGGQLKFQKNAIEFTRYRFVITLR